jgi:uncharacterized protein YqeY
MTLMNKIKTNQITARKAGALKEREASLLTTLLGEAAMIGKNANRETTDQEVVAVVKKFIKNIDETVSALTSRDQDASAFLMERTILEQYLPMQLSEAALREVAACQTDMPAFMKHLKENYTGQYDGKLASVVARSVFN